MRKYIIGFSIIAALFFLLSSAGLAVSQDHSFSAPAEKDILSASQKIFCVIYGATAKSLKDQHNGANFIYSTDRTAVAYLLPDQKSPTGEDIVNKGEVILVYVGGASAMKIRLEVNSDAQLIFDEPDKLLIVLVFDGEIGT